MKIGFLSGIEGGCYWYRTKQIFDVLKNAGHETFRILPGEKLPADLDAVQLSRSYGFDITNGVDHCKKNNIKIIYDIDDAYPLVEKDNFYYNMVIGSLPQVYQLLEAADIVTVTTERLKNTLLPFTKARVVIIPNAIDPKLFKSRLKGNKKVKIGFAGDISHIKDLNMVLPALIKAKRHGADFDFELFGIRDTDQETWYDRVWQLGTEEFRNELVNFVSYLERLDHKWHPYVPVEKYYERLSELNWDVGIAPLLNTPFNNNKSPIKFIEYAMVGTLPLCSNVEPYLGQLKEVTDIWFDDFMLLANNMAPIIANAALVKSNVILTKDIKDLESLILSTYEG